MTIVNALCLCNIVVEDDFDSMKVSNIKKYILACVLCVLSSCTLLRTPYEGIYASCRDDDDVRMEQYLEICEIAESNDINCFYFSDFNDYIDNHNITVEEIRYYTEQQKRNIIRYDFQGNINPVNMTLALLFWTRNDDDFKNHMLTSIAEQELE